MCVCLNSFDVSFVSFQCIVKNVMFRSYRFNVSFVVQTALKNGLLVGIQREGLIESDSSSRTCFLTPPPPHYYHSPALTSLSTALHTGRGGH